MRENFNYKTYLNNNNKKKIKFKIIIQSRIETMYVPSLESKILNYDVPLRHAATYDADISDMRFIKFRI